MKVSLGKVVTNQRNSNLSMLDHNLETTEWMRLAKKTTQEKDQRCCALSHKVVEPNEL